MPISLNRFCISGLHGKYDIDIPINNNRIILVGVNGLGKTTVVSILYFLLTEQWNRLFEFEFTELTIGIENQTIVIPRAELENIGDFRTRLEQQYLQGQIKRHLLPSPYATRLFSHKLFFDALKNSSEKDISFSNLTEIMADDIGVPSPVIARVIRELTQNSQGDLFEYPPNVTAFLAALRSSGEYQVLYLPTYRRIEQDLKAIFPDLEERKIRELTSRNNSPYTPSSGRSHVELVQFGMHDVEGKINEELKEISFNARNQLSNLAASYLRDVIRNKADNFDSELINTLDPQIINNILSRVEENTLNSNDKYELKNVIQRIRDDQSRVSERDKYLAHFFSLLFEKYKSLSQDERNIQRLVDICNKYLQGKHLRYNDNEYTLRIFDKGDIPINWKSLSSGEKQIVSLFTHLFLTKEKSQMVIIDEPELSLSVTWQKTLLPDILKSESCSLLIAVTHSPFIYQNELDSYAIDLAKCTRASVTKPE